MISTIPIKNLFYLLCYAWDKLEEGQKVDVSQSDYDETINLLTRVLVNGSRRLFKRGLDRNYKEIETIYVGIKGKIEINKSLNKDLFRQGMSICRFDEFELDILQNQLLKATFLRLLKIENIDKKLQRDVVDCYLKFANVKDIKVKLHLFSKVRIHRNNSFYDFLLKICQLIFENTVLDEANGEYKFKEFIGSEKAMANLFESFIRNFYKKEQTEYYVSREDINWDAKPMANSSEAFLPKMQTDVSLESSKRKIIIEIKYYSSALNTRFDVEKFNSSNLYQLYSYLRNIEKKINNPFNVNCEGILLYPKVNYSLNEQFLFGTHKIRIKTIDLSADWRIIKKELLDLCLLD